MRPQKTKKKQEEPQQGGKSTYSLRDASFDLVKELRRRWKRGISLKEIQVEPDLAKHKIVQEGIIRMSKGEGCKKHEVAAKRLTYEWIGNEITVYPTPITEEYEGKRRRGPTGSCVNAEKKGPEVQDENETEKKQKANTATEESEEKEDSKAAEGRKVVEEAATGEEKEGKSKKRQ